MAQISRLFPEGFTMANHKDPQAKVVTEPFPVLIPPPPDADEDAPAAPAPAPAPADADADADLSDPQPAKAWGAGGLLKPIHSFARTSE